MRIFFLIALVFSVVSSDGSDPTNLVVSEERDKGPFIPNGLLDSVDWPRFWKEFKIDGHIRMDCDNNILKDESPIGFDAYMIEPTLIAEVTREKWRLEFIGLTLDIGDKKKNTMETGKNREKQGFAYNHIFQFPIMGMIFSDGIDGVFCFEEGSTGIVYMSELDPSNNKTVYRLKMMPVIAQFLTEQGVINSIASCVASMGYEAIDVSKKREGQIGRSFKDIIDTFFYVNGCKGMVPIGGFSNSSDPFAAALNTTVGNLQLLSQTSPLLKQTVRSVLNGYSEDIWCGPKSGPNIMALSQYAAQIVRPTSGKVKELGVNTPSQTHFKNSLASGDNSVWLLWQRRDYSMFAYRCGKRNSE